MKTFLMHVPRAAWSVVAFAIVFSIAPQHASAQFEWQTPQQIVMPGGYAPAVMYSDTGMHYRMWFAVNDPGYWNIYYAESEDGINWSLPSYLPALSHGGPGSWDSQWAIDPLVKTDSAGFVMYYTGYDGQKWQVGMARSLDGIHWEKNPANPTFPVGTAWDSVAVMAGEVFKDVLPGDSSYFMVYNGYDGVKRRIGVAKSVDGVTWERRSTSVFGPDDGLAWDGDGVATSTVLRDRGKFYMFYQSGNEEPTETPLGVAMSYDGIHWTRRDHKPILRASMTGWTARLGFGTAVLRADTLRYWYSGDGGGWSIGYIEAPWPDTVRWQQDSICTYTLITPTDVSNGYGGPREFKLSNAYPNPFNPSTTLEMSLPLETQVSAKVYNVLGQEIAVLMDGFLPAGLHTLRWNAQSLASGTYYLKVVAGKYHATRSLILLK